MKLSENKNFRKMEILATKIAETAAESSHSASLNSENGTSHPKRKSKKKKMKKRFLFGLILLILCFEVFYLILSKLTYSEIEKLILFVSKTNRSSSVKFTWSSNLQVPELSQTWLTHPVLPTITKFAPKSWIFHQHTKVVHFEEMVCHKLTDR